MAVEGTSWVDPDAPGWVRHPASDDEWDELAADYGGDSDVSAPFNRIVEVVRENDCRTVVVENRYVDLDYRSEYAAFWAHRFQSPPPFARRLHFFGTLVAADQLHELPEEAVDAYLGYVVCRPILLGAVGRTVLRPPASMEPSVTTAIVDEVTLFGTLLKVRGAPFCQQDTEFLRCAHAAAWMCHYTAVRRGFVGRRPTATFSGVAPPLLSVHRSLPSRGLTPHQVQAVFGAMDQPALTLDFDSLPRVPGVADPTPLSDHDGNRLPGGLWDTRMVSIICRYVNSGFPVFIGTANHAFTVVGWTRENGEINFFINDDARGPYLRVDSPLTDAPRRPWQLMMVPLPPKVYLSGEMAETIAYTTFTSLGAAAGASSSMTDLATGLGSGTVKLRTYLQDGSEYKRGLQERGLEDASRRILRLARLPHFVWVVEAHDTGRCQPGEPCVIAEAVFDSTSHDRRPRHDALIGPGFLATFPPGGVPERLATTQHRWGSHLDRAGVAH
jgi:hypothetical protein